jgi:hypothetical protein
MQKIVMELDQHNTRLIESLELIRINTHRLDDYGVTIDWMRSWKNQFGNYDLGSFDKAIKQHSAELVVVSDEFNKVHENNKKMEDKLSKNKAEVLAIIEGNNKSNLDQIDKVEKKLIS